MNLEALDQAQYLLKRMLELAERSAEDGSTDDRRKDMQKGFELLRGLLDEAADQYQRGRSTE